MTAPALGGSHCVFVLSRCSEGRHPSRLVCALKFALEGAMAPKRVRFALEDERCDRTEHRRKSRQQRQQQLDTAWGLRGRMSEYIDELQNCQTAKSALELKVLQLEQDVAAAERDRDGLQAQLDAALQHAAAVERSRKQDLAVAWKEATDRAKKLDDCIQERRKLKAQLAQLEAEKRLSAGGSKLPSPAQQQQQQQQQQAEALPAGGTVQAGGGSGGAAPVAGELAAGVPPAGGAAPASAAAGGASPGTRTPTVSTRGQEVAGVLAGMQQVQDEEPSDEGVPAPRPRPEKRARVSAEPPSATDLSELPRERAAAAAPRLLNLLQAGLPRQLQAALAQALRHRRASWRELEAAAAPRLQTLLRSLLRVGMWQAGLPRRLQAALVRRRHQARWTLTRLPA
ncbi:hypothetical protein ABPG77_001164 [Micractinium sp. CCAP 211/92]